MDIGTSVFIPALNHIKLTRQVLNASKYNSMTLKGFSRIEAGKYGMRFWRVL
jgi:hypothetical protein